jgi:metacaspase-1
MMGFAPGQTTVLQDSQATLANIEKELGKIGASAGPDDRVLIYFSGHGSHVKDIDGDEEDGLDEVLLPHDFKMNTVERSLDNIWLDDSFGRQLSEIKAGHIVVFLDACHSGTATKGAKSIHLTNETPLDGMHFKYFYYPGMPHAVGKGSFTVEEQTPADNGFISLSAARDDEKAVATNRGSLFTLGVLDAFKRAGQSGEPVTIQSLEVNAREFIAGAVTDKKRVHHPFLFGDQTLANANLLKVSSTTPAPTPGATSTSARLWADIEQLIDDAGYPVNISVNKDRFRVGDHLLITCRTDKKGYLNVFNVDPDDAEATVLFPNKYHPENRVSAGETITIPSPEDKFILRAGAKSDRSLVVVFHSEEDINAYRDGYGKADELFRTMSSKSLFSYKSLRGFDVEPKTGGRNYGAGKFITRIDQ